MLEEKKEEELELPWLKKNKKPPILRAQKENEEIQERLSKIPISELERKLVEKIEKEREKKEEEEE